MLQIVSPTELPQDFPGCAVAIGKFDGLHLGHRQLLHELVEYCEDSGLASMAITFDKNPRELFDPTHVPKSIVGPGQKARLIESVGVDVLMTLEFDEELASLSPRDFLRDFIASVGAQMVFVGEGFTFGAGGQGSIEDLRVLGPEFGFRSREVASVLVDGHRISSTQIRNLLDEGNVSAAGLLLGRSHSIVGEVEHGRKLGRTLGFPTANLSRQSEGLLPADGVYAGYLIADGISYEAAHSVGTNDSVAEVPRLLESHVIGRDDLDLYGKIVECEFVDKVRGWQKFESLESLVDQIAADVDRAAEILGE